MALKKCYKLHKLFLSELERCERLDREGTQVLSSLANVGKRVPLLTAHDGASSRSSGTAVRPLGVLDFMADTPALLLEKHFLAMEKSASFLRDVIKDLFDAVRRLRVFADEFVDLVDEVSMDVASIEEEAERSGEEPGAPLAAMLSMLEWTENVRTMYERDVLRKRLLVADIEYGDVGRLQRMHREWSASASVSFVDVAYVRMGREELPPLPVGSQEVEQREIDEDEVSSTSGVTSKSKKKKKTKQ